MLMRRGMIAGGLLILGVASMALAGGAQQAAPAANAGAAPQAPQPSETVKPIKGNVYYASGSTASNNGIIVGEKGVIVVDTGISAASEKLELAEIAKITPKPITTVLFTHSDGDHVNGSEALPAGITVIAQENCKKEMKTAAATPPQNPNPAQPPAKPQMPTKTVAMKESLTIDGTRFELFHVSPAHTSGDLIVYLPDQKIVFTGDIISGPTPYPLIHLEKNGSSLGWLDTVAAMLAVDADTYVPGHGDLHTKADIQQRYDAVKARRAQMVDLVKQGKSLDEIKQQFGETATPAAGGRGPRFPGFTDVVYQELTRKN